MMAGVVIIGAGECGVSTAFALRDEGYQGTVTLIGDEASLPYERPPLSKEMSAAPKAIRSAESYADARIDLRLDTSVAALDTKSKTVHLADSTALKFGTLVLATGARARLFEGLEECRTLRTDKDAAEIVRHLKPGSRIGIVGGGFIGLELAAMARVAGSEVMVFEAGPRLLGRAVPEDIATIVQRRHEAEGVRILTGIGVERADAGTIILANGSEHPFDLVVAGIGSEPNTGMAESAGLTVKNGIVVDAGFRTSNPHVFAAGDCCNFVWNGTRVRLESWKAARDQGAYVAQSITGRGRVYAKVPWFWSDQYDLTLQVAGFFVAGQQIHFRQTNDDMRIVFQTGEDDRLIAAAGIGPGNAVAKDIKIFEKLIERGAVVDARVISDPEQKLKRLLKAA